MGHPPKIALQIEKSRAHGRALIEGIANYAFAKTDWRLELVEPCALASCRGIAQFDGIIARIMDDRTEKLLAASGKCVVDTYGRNAKRRFDTIRLDDKAIATMAAGCFREHRFRNAAYCGFPGLRFSDCRGQEFARAWRTGGTGCHAFDCGNGKVKDTFFRNERTDTPADAGALRRWLRDLPKPVAVFCCNDLRACQLLRICREMRLDVPREIAVLGVDDDALLCTFANPPLSSIDTNPFELGRKAAALLERQLAQRKGRAPALVRHQPRRIVERASTEAFPFRTPWLSDALVFIRRHLAEGVSAADVVGHLGYSHTTVGKAFAAEVGRSVQQEIIRQRLDRACRLLRETDLTAAQIATDCGYPSAQYFAHFFAKRLATTPGRWRRGEG